MGLIFSSRPTTGSRLLLITVTALALLGLAAPADAAFPGKNGKIAFVRDGQIWVMNPDGSNPNELNDSGGTPAWSADGHFLAFVRPTGPSSRTIYTVNEDGSNLTFAGGGFDPSWSPDGSHFAVSTGDHSFGNGNDRIYTVARNGTFGDQVTNPPFGTSDFTPAWSPDGSKILFERVSNGGSSLWTAMSNGLALQRVNDSLQYESYPNWSPDGKRIAFVGTTGSTTAIYLVNADGSDPAAVPNTGLDWEPAWSPDGTKLVVQHFPPPQPFGPTEIQLVDPATGAHTPLTSGDHDSDPDWQPIGNRPPDCSHVTASPDTLWPPNGKLVPVSVAGATDPDGDEVTLTITGVTQDEPTRRPDAVLGPASYQVSLRAERDGAGDGRVYRIAFRATDGRGGECSGTATVGVPHDQGAVAVDSAPPSYDSLGQG
jgi:dipeptidyl aminopeptidase/acylaminoacyl peptidase